LAVDRGAGFRVQKPLILWLTAPHELFSFKEFLVVVVGGRDRPPRRYAESIAFLGILFTSLREEMMISRTWSRKSIAFAVAIAVLSVSSMVALASPGQTKMSGELSVSGQVTVNGTSAISGATVFSDSTVQTAANSSAVVSLGKLGRVELLPNTTVKLSFSAGNISASLDSGRLQVSTLAGTAAIVTTKDGAAVADEKQAATFMVDVECGDMRVNSQAGLVELRATGKTVQVAAGSTETAGTRNPEPAARVWRNRAWLASVAAPSRRCCSQLVAPSQPRLSLRQAMMTFSSVETRSSSVRPDKLFLTQPRRKLRARQLLQPCGSRVRSARGPQVLITPALAIR
jgi:hypothetical protein